MSLAHRLYQQNYLEWYSVSPFWLSYVDKATRAIQDRILFVSHQIWDKHQVIRFQHWWNLINLHAYWKIFWLLPFNIISKNNCVKGVQPTEWNSFHARIRIRDFGIAHWCSTNWTAWTNSQPGIPGPTKQLNLEKTCFVNLQICNKFNMTRLIHHNKTAARLRNRWIHQTLNL